MSSDKKKVLREEEMEQSAKSTVISMIISLFLVGMSVAFVLGFRMYLKGHTYQGDALSDVVDQQEEGDGSELLKLDPTFTSHYIIFRNLTKKEFCATKVPGVVEENSHRFTNGELVEVVKKGSYKDGKTYYCLQDGTYVEAVDDNIQLVKTYLPLNGYVVITYISSGGVRLRSWPDYEADNVVRAVYVGDKLDIEAMITLENGVSAFMTKDHMFITTDSRYLSDYTNLQEVMAPKGDTAEEASTELEDHK